ELDRKKSDLLRSYEQAYNERDKRDSGSYAGEYLRHFLEGEPSQGIERELELVRELLPSIGLEQINRLAQRWISEANRVVLVSGPEKTEVPLPAEETLAEIFRAVEGSQIEAYVDEVRREPLLAETPEPSPVVDERTIEGVGVTEWRLANGVRVVLKPTDFKNDQVLLTGFSPGGHSLVADEYYTSAAFAAAVVGEGGLGTFSQVELEKALAGKLAGARAYIGELEEGVNASAAPQDLETMFQLLYLAITSPRADREAFQAFTARLEASLENRHARPEAVFQDRITLALYQGHPRRRPPSLEMLDEIRLDTALEVYRDRFRDADDFTFILVGRFDLETIRPLVETYLGGLPSTERQESWRDVGVQTPDGIVELQVRKGLEPKSRIRLIFGGPAQWSRESVHDIRSLAAAFRIRLREILREDLGATYGVSVGGSIDDRPRGRFAFSIGLGCAPENVERMLETIFAEIDSLRRQGLDESYAQKVRESQLRRRETDLKENPFWLAALKLYYARGLDPRLLLDFDRLVERVTPANLKASAERYLDAERYLLGVLYPAEADSASTLESAAAAADSPRAGQARSF
ncbi:MAG: insulinase family protein, partial [Thermoanaerobaculia bacterium]